MDRVEEEVLSKMQNWTKKKTYGPHEVRIPKTIKCGCGYDSGIPMGEPLLMVIPHDGLKCSQCGHILIQGDGLSC